MIVKRNRKVFVLRLAIGALVMLVMSGCGLIKKRDPATDDPNSMALKISQKPLPPEKTKQLLSEVGSNWLYGQGVGETALNIGTSIIFPPFLIYLLGNAALSIGGYEPIELSNTLPEEAASEWRAVYNTVTEGPGRVSAAIAGEEFRTTGLAKDRIEQAVGVEP